MTNRAALILSALSGLLGGYANARKENRDRDFEERKLAIQERTAENKNPSAGIANIKYIEGVTGAPLTKEEMLGVVSPSGFALSPEMRAYLSNPEGVKSYLKDKANAGKTKIDFGGDSGEPNPSSRDDPSSQRPAIRAPGSSATLDSTPEVRPAPTMKANEPQAATSSGAGPVRKRFNPKTGELETIQRVSFKDLPTGD